MARYDGRGRRTQRASWLAALAAIIAPTGIDAAERTNTLIVPTSAQTLDIAVPLPKHAVATSDSRWQLVEQTPGNTVCAAQIIGDIRPNGTPSEDRVLVASIPPSGQANPIRRFLLAPCSSTDKAEPQGTFRFSEDSDTSLAVHDGTQDVFVYNHGLVTKESVSEDDHRRTKACYVHPLYGIRGEKVYLRAVDREDLKLIHKWKNDSEFMALDSFSPEHVISLTELEKAVLNCRSGFDFSKL